MAGFAGGRIQTAGRAVGVMRAAFEKAISYSKERVVFSHPIGDYQLTGSSWPAWPPTWLPAARSPTGRPPDGRGQGRHGGQRHKLFTCKTAEWVTREALQIHGGMGYAEEVPVSRYFVDAGCCQFSRAPRNLALKVITRSLMENAA